MGIKDDRPQIDKRWRDGSTRRIKSYPESPMGVDPDEGDTVECCINVTGSLWLPCELTITGHGDTWDSGSRYSYGEVDWTQLVDSIREELGGPLPDDHEEMLRDRLSGIDSDEGLSPDDVDHIISELKQ